MSRYIDFYLIGELVDFHGNVHYEDLKNLPTADVVEVVHGEWVDNGKECWDGSIYYFRQCDICGFERDDCNADYDTPYCPNCGAKMERREDELHKRL